VWGGCALFARPFRSNEASSLGAVCASEASAVGLSDWKAKVATGAALPRNRPQAWHRQGAGRLAEDRALCAMEASLDGSHWVQLSSFGGQILTTSLSNRLS
jgi:hypothetical protein